MARPGSRGGMAPGSVVRPGSGVGRVPGSAVRLNTAQRAAASYGGVGLNTQLQVADRPVTQQGMMGMRIKTAGPGRQYRDVSYYLSTLRTKNSELTAEIAKLKEEVEQFHKDQSAYQAYERKYESLITEVRSLEGQLADYNLAMDKSRTSTDPAEIQHFFMSLKAKNERESEEIDNIFVERQERDNAIRRLEEEHNRIREEAAARMSSLPPAQQERYRALMEENKVLAEKITGMQGQLERFNSEVEGMEGELSRDPWRDEFARLEKAMVRKTQELDGVREEAEATKMDPAEARAKLLAKVKENTAAIQAVDRDVEDLKAEVSGMHRTASELSTDIEERKGEAGESHKYEVLFQRDQEMTEFIEKFPAVREKELAAQAQTEEMNVKMLEHMSKDLERQHNMPSRSHHSEMQEDLSFKERAIESSASTQARLEQDLAKRRAELEKINTLDQKISLELQSLREKMGNMTSEMSDFGNIDMLKIAAENTRRQLLSLKSQYLRRRDMIRTQVGQLSAQYERKKAALEENDTAKALGSLEQKLRHYEQSIFSIREYIETKGKESDYKALAEECMKLSDDLNAHIMRAQAAITPMAAATAAPY